MRHILSIFIVALSLQLSAFDGIIKVNYKQFNGTNDRFNFTWKFKGDKCLVQMDLIGEVQNSTVFITDLANQRFLTYNLGVVDKTYYEIPLTLIEGYTNKHNIQITGEKKTIAGQDCQKYVFTTESNSIEVWVTAAISIDWKKYAPFFKTSEEVQAMAEHNIIGFPMEVVVKNEQGMISQSSAATYVSKAPVEEATFILPAGYKPQALDSK